MGRAPSPGYGMGFYYQVNQLGTGEVMSPPIPEEAVDEVRRQSDLVTVVEDYIKLEKKGKSWVGLCPFHGEKTASFSVSAEKQLYYCFGCGAGGNVFNFIMQMENLAFMDAVRFLAQRAGVKLPETIRQNTATQALREKVQKLNELAVQYFRHCLLHTAQGEKIVAYLEERGIDRTSSELFNIGYAPPGWDQFLKTAQKRGLSPELLLKAGLASPKKGGGAYDRFRNRLIFPIYDLKGRVVGFGGRALAKGSGPKYLNSPETVLFDKGSVLYGLHLSREQIRRSGEAIVMEGYTDVITAHRHGLKNTVASLGTALTCIQARLLRAQTPVVTIAFDADSAGEAAAWRGFKTLQDAGCRVRVALFPPGSDPDSYMCEKGAAACRGVLDQALPVTEYQLWRLRERCDCRAEEGRQRFLQEALELLQTISSPVERDVYLKKAAEELAVTEGALREELQRRGRGVRLSQSPGHNLASKDQTTSIKQITVNPAEKMLLALVIMNGSIAGMVRESLDETDFASPVARRILAAVRRMHETGTPPTPEGMIDYFSEPEIHKLITEAVMDKSLSGLPGETMKRMARDCIKRIKRYGLIRRREALARELQSLEKQGQEEEARKLRRECQSILTRKRSYRSVEGDDF